MPRTDRWPERIGAVFVPHADAVEDRTPPAEGPPNVLADPGGRLGRLRSSSHEAAALLLDPDVGRAVALGDLKPFERAARRVERARAVAGAHPANRALDRLGLRR